jgi:hypothetical protein
MKLTDTDASSSDTFPPARRGPQNEGLVSASSAQHNVLHFPIRNFTKVASFRFSPNSSSSSNSVSSPVSRKPFFVLTLTNPKKLSTTTTTTTANPSIFREHTTVADVAAELISNSIAEINQTVNETVKTFRILDKLRNLTNLRLQGKSSGLRFGIKGYGRNRLESGKNSSSSYSEKNQANSTQSIVPTSTPFAIRETGPSNTSNSNDDNETNSPVVAADAKVQMSKVAGHLTQLITSSSSPVPKPLPPKEVIFRSTTPIILKIGNLAKLQQQSSRDGNGTDPEGIKTGETRVAITADQLAGGNRPTKTPFHFTSAAPTESTTIGRGTAQINRYKKPYSPHNHAYAPTQDPVESISNGDEDLSVEEYQDIRRANQAFGFKVND